MVTKIINGITSTINISESTESLDDLPIFAGTVKSTDDRLLEIVGNDDADITLVDVEGLLGSNVFYIRQESDFPVQDDTKITLGTGVYVITENVLISKPFVLLDDASVDIYSVSLSNKFLLCNIDGTIFTGKPRFLYVHDIFVLGNNGVGFDSDATVFDIELAPVGRTTLYTRNVSLFNVADVGAIDGVTTLFMFDTDFSAFGAGLKVSNVLQMQTNVMRLNNLISGVSSNDIGISLSGAMGSVIINGLAFEPITGESVYFIDPAITVNSLTISDGAFNRNSGGTFFAAGSLDETDVRFNIVNNGQQRDSATFGEFLATDNSTETVITAQNTPVKIVVTAASGNFERVTYTDRRLTYVGSADITLRVQAVCRAFINQNNEDDTFSVYLAKNGTVLPDSQDKQVLGTAISNPSTLFIPFSLIELSTNDFIEVFVENNSTSNENIVFETLKLVAS